MNPPHSDQPRFAPWRTKLYTIIFEADTFGGKLFDIALLVAIVVSVAAICFETVLSPEQQKVYGLFFEIVEWVFTVLFAVEYALRVICVKRPRKYILSFYGIVDLLAFLPSFVAALLGMTDTSFGVVRAIRLLRVFRILKLVYLVDEGEDLGRAVWRARAKIIVFLTVVLIAVTITGAAMFEVEPDNFHSIPEAMYWAIVTMTTVGYGDLVPQTALGKLISAMLIILGYSLIIVPTGFVSAELIQAKSRRHKQVTTRTCPHCVSEGHDNDADFCKYCGELLSAKA